MTRKYYETLGLTYRADSLYTDENLSETKSLDGVDIIQSKANLQEGMESMLDTMKTMITILIVVSAILGFVIIYNLGILSFTEKQYQFATLKVLGFKNQQIKKIGLIIINSADFLQTNCPKQRYAKSLIV